MKCRDKERMAIRVAGRAGKKKERNIEKKRLEYLRESSDLEVFLLYPMNIKM